MVDEEVAPSDAIAELCAERAAKNSELLTSLREDAHSRDLLAACEADQTLGRSAASLMCSLFISLLSDPVNISPGGPGLARGVYHEFCFSLVCRMGPTSAADEVDLGAITLTPRFCIEQGTKADGTPKLRPVDDFSRSGCNAATFPGEKLVYESLDHFLAAIRMASVCLGISLSMWKADIDSAYRRIPVLPAHRQFAWVSFLCGGIARVAQHFALPFGSVASVHHWNRIGEPLLLLVLHSSVVMCSVSQAR